MEICSGDGRRARYVDPWSCYPLTLSSRNTLPFFPAPPAFLRDGPPVCWDDMMLIVQHRGRLENETDLNRHGLVEMLRFVVLIRGGRGSPPGPGTSGGRRFSVSASNDRSRLLISPRTNHHPFFCRLNHFHHVTNTQFRRRPRFRSRHQTHQPRRARWLTCPLHPSSSGRVLRVLTGVQNTSALVFSVFVGVHLVSPVVAAIGGASVADKSLVSDSSDVSCSSWVTWRVSHVSRLTYYHSFSPENTTSP
jgi:hypothetical protein